MNPTKKKIQPSTTTLNKSKSKQQFIIKTIIINKKQENHSHNIKSNLKDQASNHLHMPSTLRNTHKLQKAFQNTCSLRRRNSKWLRFGYMYRN
ncbi:uncharacterized protein DS421_14g453340 [Arachis hypogaea]|nr:uncharacterized protein DS421_14g453340 [Arachis hypogaea]